MPLPHLSPVASRAKPGVLLAMPPGFRPVSGLQSAWRGREAATFAPKAEGDEPTVAQLNGLRYERRVKAEFAPQAAVEFGPWFFFRDQYGTRRCQPDMLFSLAGWLVIAEIKLLFTTDAWWQLRRLYEPVVSNALDRHTRCLVITATYDPAVPWPEEIRLMRSAEDLDAWIKKDEPNRMGVVWWDPAKQ